MARKWEDYLRQEYPNRILPFDIQELHQYLEHLMKKGIIQKDKKIKAMGLSLKMVLLKAGFSYQSKNDSTKVPVGQAVSNKKNTDAKSVFKQDESGLFEDNFDPISFLENIDKQDLIHVQRSFEDNTELARIYQTTMNRNTEEYADLFKVNQLLVQKVVGHYHYITKQTCLSDEDLIGYGNEGLAKAIDKFDPGAGYAFSTYAVWWIRQAVSRSIMDEGWTIRIPVHMVEQLNKLNSLEKQQLSENQVTDESAICCKMGISHERYQYYHQVQYQFRSGVSLNKIVSTNDSGGTEIGSFVEHDNSGLIEKEKNAECELLNADLRQRLRQLLHECSEREENIIKLRFGLDDQQPKTLEQIGRQMGVTRERIRQIENKALKRLKFLIERQGREEFEFERQSS